MPAESMSYKTAETCFKFVRRHYPHVRILQDAKKWIDISVNKQDTANGKPRSFTDCPFARACQRGDFDAAIITVSRAYLIKGDKAYRYIVTNGLSREITVLDRTKENDKFTPGTFRLNAPTKSTATGPRQSPEKRVGRHKPTGKRPKPSHYTEGVRHIRG